jgi:FemAB-related protein (PEP-CTERM system-associated)
MRIEMTPTAPAGWDVYVGGHSLGTTYHRSKSVAIGRTAFGLKTYFLAALDGPAGVVGVLPLVEQSSVLFGRFMVSVPFFTYGGILADNADVAVALAEYAAELAREKNARHLELRHTGSIDGLALAVRLEKVSMIRELPKTVDELANGLGSKLRSQIRRTEREDPQVAWGGVELLPEFYRVFSESMHDLGTPVYPRKFFRESCSAFGDLASVLVVRVRGIVQAAAIVVRHRDRIEVPWAAATATAKTTAINMRMYWELLKFSVERGSSHFDFGRSTVNSGTYRFKAQWGAVPCQLHWHYWLPTGANIPQLNNANPKYAAAAAIWRRMPLWCANAIGPLIVRNLP